MSPVLIKTSTRMGWRLHIFDQISTTSGFGTLMQSFKSNRYRNKRMLFSGVVKTEDVSGWAGLWMRIDGQKGETMLRQHGETHLAKEPRIGNGIVSCSTFPKRARASSSACCWMGKGRFGSVACSLRRRPTSPPLIRRTSLKVTTSQGIWISPQTKDVCNTNSYYQSSVSTD